MLSLRRNNSTLAARAPRSDRPRTRNCSLPPLDDAVGAAQRREPTRTATPPGTHRRARPRPLGNRPVACASAGRPAKNGRTSPIVSSSREVVAICRSAALTVSPPSTPSAQPAVDAVEVAGQRAQVGARPRPRAAPLRRRSTPPTSGASAQHRGRGQARQPRAVLVADHRARAPRRSVVHTRRRAIGCHTSSPHSSARSTSARASGSAGKSGGSGASSSRRAQDGARADELLAGLERQPGHRPRAEAQRAAGRRAAAAAARRPRRARPSCRARAAPWRTGASRGRRRASPTWARSYADAPRRRRRQHPDPLRDLSRRRSSSSTGASPPCATSTADELGAALRNLLELRGIGLADLTASIVSSTVPQLRARVAGDGRRATSTTRMLVVGPGLRTGMALRYDNPREIGARPPGQRRRGLRPRQAAPASSSTSAPR